MNHTIAALVVIETDGDPLLDEEKFDLLMQSPQGAEALREAVMTKVHRASTRLVMVTSEAHARLMCHANDAALRAMGEEDLILRPPAGYVPPADRR